MKETKFKNTEIGRIPEEWEVSPLVDLCLQITDGSHESPIEAEYGHYMPSVKDMYTNGFNFASCKKISEKDYQRLVNNGCKPQKGDVLIAKDGSILKYSFDLKEDLPIVLLSSIAIIRPCHSEIDSGYLALFFRQPMFIERVLANFKTGTGVPRIVLRNFEKIHISYPYDLTEQHHIASALTSIDNLISSLGKLIEKKKNIKQGTMQQLLTGKTRLKGFSEPWVEKTLGDVAVNYTGLTYSPMNVKSYGTLVLRSSNIQKGILVFNDNVFVDMDIPSRAIAKKNDLLICVRNGSKALIGKSAVITDYADGMAFGAFMTILHANDIQQGFLNYLWQADYIQQQVKDNMGATINQITNADIEQFKIVVPHSLKEQQAIATILTKMDNEITALEAKRAKYEAIKQGMMQQLLTGKIRLIS